MMQTDRRILQTRDKLYQALLAFYKAGGAFSALTVRQLCVRADVSRQTFYRHYNEPKEIITKRMATHQAEFLHSFRMQNLNARSMVTQLVSAWDGRTELFELVEWADCRQKFIQDLADFNARIAQQNGVHLIDGNAIDHIYAASCYMFLRAYILEKRWDRDQGVKLLLHLTNNMDMIFE